MKQFYYFLTANLLLWVCSLFLTSCEKEDVPPPIDLNTLCKTFQRQQLQLYVNGVEYFGHTVTFAQNKTTDVENNSSTMFLGISPLWPNVRNYTSSEEYDYEWIEMPVSVEATSNEVFFQGILPIYEKNTVIGTEGCWKNDTLRINVIYRANIDGITDNTFIFDFTNESINLDFLHPNSNFIEYDGEKIPTKEFVKEAFGIFLKAIRNNLGGANLQLTFNRDGSVNMGLKHMDKTTYVPINGHHAYRLHTSEYGFLQSDSEGGKAINRLLGLVYGPVQDATDGFLYTWQIGGQYFMSIYYDYDPHTSNLRLGIGSKSHFYAYNFWKNWAGLFMYPMEETVHGLSVEETKKIRKMVELFSNQDIHNILLSGKKQ